MRIAVDLTWDEQAAVRLLNWLARENARIFRERPDLPGVYESGVVYRREKSELWCDAAALVAQGHEDCDGLAAMRAGELLARGGRALLPSDHGYKGGRNLRSIAAQVMLTTDAGRSDGGRLYHCIVRYKVRGRWYRDDPSLRLGMRPGLVDANVLRVWDNRGVVPAVLAGAERTSHARKRDLEAVRNLTSGRCACRTSRCDCE
jgi:hypothetical protein